MERKTQQKRSRADRDAKDHRQDPDEYDPVGMAGKKAGIVEELKEEAANERSKKSSRPRKEK